MATDIRRVHAENDRLELVRYDRASKWFVEPRPGVRDKRRVISIHDAVALAVKWSKRSSGKIHHGLSGGAQFDRLFKKATAPDE